MPKTPVKPPVKVAARRSKAEVEQEFDKVREQAEQAREEFNPKLEEQTRLRETAILESVSGVTVDEVVQRIGALNTEISRALNGLSSQLTGEAERLLGLRQASDIERRELERLHQLDVAATAIDGLVREHARRKQELEAEIAAQRTAWEESVRAAERERKEQEEAQKKQRLREAEEFEYKKVLERKKAQDKYDEDQRLLEKKNQEKQEGLLKSWQAREAAIKEREDEMAALRNDARLFPDRLRAEVERGAAEATRQTESRFEQQILLLKKEADTEKRLADLRIKTLEDLVAQQSNQIAALQKQLDEAKQQVQDIAIRAIEGASGSRALTHINQIAMEQAKNRSPQG